MNKRIEELAKEHGFIHDHMSVGERHDALKKFQNTVELIVNECCDVINKDCELQFNDGIITNLGGLNQARELIKEHFKPEKPYIRETSVAEMADVVMSWLDKLPLDVAEEFRVVPYDDLIQFKNLLGMNIRNEFRLWEKKWTPMLVNGVDFSPDHPDAISMEVIKEVWRRLQC